MKKRTNTNSSLVIILLFFVIVGWGLYHVNSYRNTPKPIQYVENFSDIVPVSMHGHSLEIPYGYFSRTLRNWDGNSTVTLNRLFINFLMPDKSYPNVRTFWDGSDRALKLDKSKVKPKRYLVKIQVDRMFSRHRPEDADITPEKKIKNAFGPRRTGGKNIDYRFGLMRITQPGTEGEWEYYRHIEGSNSRLFWNCTGPKSLLLNPGCDGYVFFPKDNLGFRIYVSKKHLSNWHEFLTAAKELLESWLVKNSSANNLQE